MREKCQEYDITKKTLEAIKSYVKAGKVYGFAEIQIDSEGLAEKEITIELKQLGINPDILYCYDSEPAEDLPEDWFDDYNIKFIFIGTCTDVKALQNNTSYILEIHEITEEDCKNV